MRCTVRELRARMDAREWAEQIGFRMFEQKYAEWLASRPGDKK